jgi:hypothetical protein
MYGAYHATLLKFGTAFMFTIYHSLPDIRVSMLIFASFSGSIYAYLSNMGLTNC